MAANQSSSRLTWRRMHERWMGTLVTACGCASIVFVGLIFLFLFKEGVLLFRDIGLIDFLAGTSWYPISEPPKFGVVPLLIGSLYVTAGALIIAVPLSLASALYIAEVAKGTTKELLKSGIELLAAIPSVVIGFIGMTVLAPVLRQTFHLPTGLTAFTGSVTLAFMAVPTIISITEDAITAIPRSYRDGALALGATKWQTMYRILLPAAAPGIVAAVMLGIGRVIGETMAVMMVTGNSSAIPTSILQPARTLTATIAAEMGETVRGSDHYYALFAVGIVLFLITFMINWAADLFLHREQR